MAVPIYRSNRRAWIGSDMSRAQFHLMKLCVLVPLVFALSACSKTVQWEEEVPLNTGDVMWVKREVTYKFKGAGGNPLDMGYRPDWTEEIAFEWKGKKYRYVGDARLMLLAIQPNTQLPVLVAPKGTHNWIRSRDFPCVKPYYEQLVVNEDKWEWQLLTKLEPWVFNLPRNLMAHRGEIDKVSVRYFSIDRQKRDSTMTAQSPYLAQINPSYQPEICTR